METLRLQFPLFVVSAQETETEGKAEFNEFVPNKKMTGKTSMGNKPVWVKSLPKTKTVWAPITLDKVLFLFASFELAKYVSNEEKLPFVYGTLEFISLESPQEVGDWITKSGAEKVKLFTVLSPPGSEFSAPEIATSEISVSDLKFEEENEQG